MLAQLWFSELLALGDEGGTGEVGFALPLEKVAISVISHIQ